MDAAYAAGLFDGEGTIYITADVDMWSGRTRHALKVFVASTSLEVLHWLFERYGGTVSGPLPRFAGHKDAYRWQLNGQKAETFLRQIRPYAIIKKPHIDVAMRLRATTTRGRVPLSDEVVAFRTSLKEELRILNKRGTA